MPNICKNCNNDFTIYPQDKEFYNKIGVPEPDICVDCRRQRLMAFWPYGQFYQRKCDKTGEDIITTFSPQVPFPVYKKEYWLKDDWQPPEAEFDLAKPFLEQLEELQKKTPHYHQLTDGTIFNCDYCDDVYTSKNCYLTRSFADCEDLYFCYRLINCKDSFDCVYSYNLEKCHSCIRCWHSYNCQYCLESRDCLDSMFLYDCRGCKNCLLSWNLRNAEYYILNKKYTKEEYQKKLAEYNFGSWQEINRLKKEFKEILKTKAIHRLNFNIKTMKSSGNYITDCKNCQNCFFIEAGEDCYNLVRAAKNKDVYDSVGSYKVELGYMSGQTVDCYNCKFVNYAIRCRDSEYLDQCEDCNDCFGCVGLQKKKHCILNKQYSEDDYKNLIVKLKEKMRTRGEYGEFFLLSIAYQGYNNSLAFQYFPETKENIKAKGGWWQEDDDKDIKFDLEEKDLPDDIKDITDEIVKKTVKCPRTGKIFRYYPQEIKFYKENNIPLPRHYYNYRITENFKKMMPLNPREVECANCNKKIITYYPKEWEYQNIYCEECYRAEIY